MKFLILIILIFTTEIQAKEISFNQWTKNELAKIPEYLHLDFPIIDVAIDEVDQQFMAMNADPWLRNIYINQSYSIIAQELQKCIGHGPNVTNWYHFAAWASRSAGDVINGLKFENLNRSDQILFDSISSLGIILNRNDHKKLFSSTNALIAMEMITAGNIYLKLFCGPKVEAFVEIFKYIKPLNENSNRILSAFSKYYDAQNTSNQKIKLEYTLLGSINQVEAEQIRVDKILKKLFSIRLGGRFGERLFHASATKRAGLKIGNREKIELNKPIKFLKESIEIENPTLRELKDIFEHYSVPSVSNGLVNVSCNDWSNLECRMRFLSGFFWGYIHSKNVVEPPHRISKYFESIKDLKKYYSNHYVTPFDSFLRDIYIDLKKSHKVVLEKIGDENDFQKRSNELYSLYEEDEEFIYGINLSYLTLITGYYANVGKKIENKFSYLGKLKLVKDLKSWGEQLKKINKKTVKLLILSKHIFEISKKYNASFQSIIYAAKYDKEIFLDVVEALPLLTSWEKLSLNQKQNFNVAKEFIHWEHFYITQPMIDFALLHVSETFEEIIHSMGSGILSRILPITHLDLNIHLNCFKENSKNSIKNYLNPLERSKVSSEFLRQLSLIDFDPNGTCLNDPIMNDELD